MLGPQHPLPRLQRPAIQRLCRPVIPLAVKQCRQVVDAGERIRMLGPQHPLPRLQRPAQRQFRGRKKALAHLECAE